MLSMHTPSVGTKLCGMCQQDLPLEAFHRSSRGSQGRQSRCKSCATAAREEYAQRPGAKERQREQSRRQTAKRKSDPVARERQRQYLATWRARNREHHNATANAWRKTNPEGARVGSARTRAKLHRVVNTLTVAEWLEVIEQHGNVCAYCGGAWSTMDHVVPMSKGGANAAHNVVPACQHCNYSKHTRDKPTPKENQDDSEQGGREG